MTNELTPPDKQRKPWGYSIIVRAQLDLNVVEKCGALGLSIKETAAYLGVGTSRFHEWRRDDPDIQAALDRGRAKMLAQCAKTVAESAKSDPRSALEYLRRHGEMWGDRIGINGELNVTGSAPAKLPDIPEPTAIRMAKVYLEQRGWTLIPPNAPIITVEAKLSAPGEQSKGT